MDLMCYDPPQKKPSWSWSRLRHVNLLAPRHRGCRASFGAENMRRWWRNFISSKEAIRNKCLASSNKCLTSSNKEAIRKFTIFHNISHHESETSMEPPCDVCHDKSERVDLGTCRGLRIPCRCVSVSKLPGPIQPYRMLLGPLFVCFLSHPANITIGVSLCTCWLCYRRRLQSGRPNDRDRTPWFRNFPCCLAESTHAAIQC